MIQRLYVHNYRCLENFELNMKSMASVLLIGKNGSGKSTISYVLEIFKSIGRGVNRVRQLVTPEDAVLGRIDIPVRFEIEVWLGKQLYTYELALELPPSFKEYRIMEERLTVEGAELFVRKEALVTLFNRKGPEKSDAQFFVDWHLVALPVIQEQSEKDPLRTFRTWLARMIILSPIPSSMSGESREETLEPERNGSNFAEWFSGLLSRHPAAYTTINRYLRSVIPDFQDVMNETTGKESKNMLVRFEANNTNVSLDFKHLSDGEKCFFLCALVIAANESYGPLFCFWDEPDNYLALSEVGLFVTSLRRAFKDHAQILATSHNEETIRKFSDENIFVLDRKSHLEPVLIRRLNDLSVNGDLVDTLIRGDIEL